MNARRVRDAFAAFSGEREADLMLMLGDNAYIDGTDAEYQAAVFDTYPDQLRRLPLWPTIGNHDARSSDGVNEVGPYFDMFTLPKQGECGGQPSGTEAYYSFDYGDVHFVCLDSATIDTSHAMTMYAWLLADLASTDKDWTIAYWHHPPYSRGSHNSDFEGALIGMRQFFVPVLENFGIDLVLSGHSHSYERSMLIKEHYGLSSTWDPTTMLLDGGDGRLEGGGAYRKASRGFGPLEGQVFVVAGCSGLVTQAALGHPVMSQGILELGSVLIDVWGDQLDLAFLDHYGALRDEFTIVKGGATPMDRHRYAVAPQGTLSYLDSGQAPPANWTSLAFDDSSWASGAMPAGYGLPGLATTVSAGSNPNQVPVTTWFRSGFDLLLDPALVETLRLRIDADDGYVVYLNGSEVARSNLPAGTLSPSTLASSDVDPDGLELIDLSGSLGLLLPGANVIAIEVHQSGPASSDLFLDFDLGFEVWDPFLAAEAAGNTRQRTARL